MAENNNTYLSFYLGNELFGINVGQIIEVLLNEPVSPIPKSRDFIEGIVNFRGEVVTVIDLFKKINVPENEDMKKNIIAVIELVANEKTIRVGALVNKVKKVFTIENDQLLPVPEFGEYYNPEYLLGVAKLDDEFVMLLDIEKVLNENEVNIILDTTK